MNIVLVVSSQGNKSFQACMALGKEGLAAPSASYIRPRSPSITRQRMIHILAKNNTLHHHKAKPTLLLVLSHRSNGMTSMHRGSTITMNLLWSGPGVRPDRNTRPLFRGCYLKMNQLVSGWHHQRIEQRGHSTSLLHLAHNFHRFQYCHPYESLQPRTSCAYQCHQQARPSTWLRQVGKQKKAASQEGRYRQDLVKNCQTDNQTVWELQVALATDRRPDNLHRTDIFRTTMHLPSADHR
mmetsp:Transcript_56856/g.138414  ORF Transcript_56856/g.138414 Transcript_56856/m.138414 type:complete len:239 (+) Transcript_56856:3092-3808(+)